MKNVEFDCGALVCPACGGSNLHQVSVEVYDHYDTHVTIRPGYVLKDLHMGMNPAEGVSAVQIHFDCETCDPETVYHVLDIVQNQGCTYLTWGRIGRLMSSYGGN